MSRSSGVSRVERQRHALLSAWRGAPEPPLGQRPLQSVSALINPIIQECGLADRVRLEEVLAAWREIVGDFLFNQSRPDSLNRGILTVRLLQPAVHHALMMEKPRILARLRERLGPAGVKDLRFKHG